MVFINRFIPFFIFYYFADIVYFLLFHVIKYRRKVVESNLVKVFPDKEVHEIVEISQEFYKNLADIMLESVKGFSTSHAELVKRYKIINPEIVDKYFENNQNIILIGAHYTNWEWGALTTGTQVKHHLVALYKPLSNKYIDRYLHKRRALWDMEMASIYSTFRVFDKKRNIPAGVIMLADQCPTNMSRAYILKFLGHDTACLHGPEKYAIRYNLPLFYANMQRIKRGYYHVTLESIEENPTQCAEGEVTQKYMKRLEEIILDNPANWLWSHRRWKRIKSKNRNNNE